MDELLKRMQGNFDYRERMTLQVSEIGAILTALDSKDGSNAKALKDRDARIKELEEEVRELQVELADAWAQVLHG